jgi:hypothetical protein
MIFRLPHQWILNHQLEVRHILFSHSLEPVESLGREGGDSSQTRHCNDSLRQDSRASQSMSSSTRMAPHREAVDAQAVRDRNNIGSFVDNSPAPARCGPPVTRPIMPDQPKTVPQRVLHVLWV